MYTVNGSVRMLNSCLLYTSDAADDLLCVDLGGRRIIKKKKKTKPSHIVKGFSLHHTIKSNTQ